MKGVKSLNQGWFSKGYLKYLLIQRSLCVCCENTGSVDSTGLKTNENPAFTRRRYWRWLWLSKEFDNKQPRLLTAQTKSPFHNAQQISVKEHIQGIVLVPLSKKGKRRILIVAELKLKKAKKRAGSLAVKAGECRKCSCHLWFFYAYIDLLTDLTPMTQRVLHWDMLILEKNISIFLG